MRTLLVLMTGAMALSLLPSAFGQEHKLNLVIVEGDGAVNNIRQRTAREPIVQVEDENHKPVAGAAVLFALPTRGPGAAFTDGSHQLTVMTDAQGRAAARGVIPNNVKGQFQIQVTASFGGMTAGSVITQTNAAAAGGGGATHAAAAGLSTKVVVIIAVAAAAAAGGAYAATHIGSGNNGSSSTIPAGTTITAGTGTVGPPR
jgi:hypothetical protein